jgi:steroid delta-isomerase-like uncharacterized protein
LSEETQKICNLADNPAKTVSVSKETAMSETNKKILEKFNQAMTQFWQSGDSSVFDEVVAKDCVIHQSGMPTNLEGLKQVLPAFRAAFPDFKVLEVEMFGEDDKVADRITWTATHTGELMGIPATGKTVTVKEMHLSRLKGGKVVERWGQWDQLGMMQQLGVVPQINYDPRQSLGVLIRNLANFAKGLKARLH